MLRKFLTPSLIDLHLLPTRPRLKTIPFRHHMLYRHRPYHFPFMMGSQYRGASPNCQWQGPFTLIFNLKYRRNIEETMLGKVYGDLPINMESSRVPCIKGFKQIAFLQWIDILGSIVVFCQMCGIFSIGGYRLNIFLSNYKI